MPLFEKARIEAYLPDLSQPAYQDLLAALEQEFTYTFGGCTTIRGLEGSYLSQLGTVMPDRINLVYTDAPFSLGENANVIGNYAESLQKAVFDALQEEAILVVVLQVYHSG